ncbi:MAG TPA: R3H domain-containing nucleic acid-binding protein [Galbitalea sp.]|jgi:spoIIIJ-associated protein
MSDVTETESAAAEVAEAELIETESIDSAAEDGRDDAVVASPASADGESADDAEPRSAGQIEEEGDIAADYIEELLDIADLDGDIDIDTRGGRAYISVSAGEGSTNLRILSKPDTVNALQELTRIAVQTKSGAFSRLILDVGGSRDARATELGVLVDKAISRLDDGAEAASLPAMSSYERKLVHDIVSERGYVSESEGEGRDRHTVISRAK